MGLWFYYLTSVDSDSSEGEYQYAQTSPGKEESACVRDDEAHLIHHLCQGLKKSVEHEIIS